MIPIRLNIVGHFTKDIDVHVVPSVGSGFNYHGFGAEGEGIVDCTGRVDKVIYCTGHKNTMAAMVIVSSLSYTPTNESLPI